VQDIANDFQRYYHYPTIFWLSVGEWGDEIRGGPAREAGFCIMPSCNPMCCRPAGPFVAAAVALAWARQEVEKSESRALAARDESVAHGQGVNTAKGYSNAAGGRSALLGISTGKARSAIVSRGAYGGGGRRRPAHGRERRGSEKKASALIAAEAFNLPRN
jgi:hypothetical protein